MNNGVAILIAGIIIAAAIYVRPISGKFQQLGEGAGIIDTSTGCLWGVDVKKKQLIKLVCPTSLRK